MQILFNISTDPIVIMNFLRLFISIIVISIVTEKKHIDANLL